MDREDHIRIITAEIMDKFVGAGEARDSLRTLNLGPLREADIRSRVRYMVEHWQEIKGHPAETAPEDWPEIADEAIAQSFACEAAAAVRWDVRLTILIAHHTLRESNCHTEARALREAARKMGEEF